MHVKKNALVMILILSSAYSYAPDHPCFLTELFYNSSRRIVHGLSTCNNDETALSNLMSLIDDTVYRSSQCGEAWGGYTGYGDGYNDARKELWTTSSVMTMGSLCAIAGACFGQCIGHLWLKHTLRKGSKKAAEDSV